MHGLTVQLSILIRFLSSWTGTCPPLATLNEEGVGDQYQASGYNSPVPRAACSRGRKQHYASLDGGEIEP